MKLLSTVQFILKMVQKRFLAFPRKKKLFVVAIAVLILGFSIWRIIINDKNKQPTYETSTVEKGMLITSISASRTITTGNTASITTGATGIVKTLYVKNGDMVTKGDKIAEIALDEYGQKRQAAAWLSYINAQNAVKTATTGKNITDIDMWNARQAIIDAEEDIDYMMKNPTNPATGNAWTDNEKTVLYKTLEKENNAFKEAELEYQNDDANIQNASVRVTAAWYDFQQVSATVLAPESGTVQNLILAVGSSITNSSDTSISIDTGTSSTNSLSTNTSLTASSQSVGFIKSNEGQFKATVSLSEVDVPSIKSDQKVTLSMDAFPDNSFTGKVLAVDTTGTVSSGVTTYLVTILLDPTTIDIYPKMSISAEIITLVKPDVLLVPSEAVTTLDDTSTVQVLKNGKVSTVTVNIGNSNDTQTEITSGLTDGDVVITNVILKDTTSTTGTKNTSTSGSSIFSGMGGMGGIGRPPD